GSPGQPSGPERRPVIAFTTGYSHAPPGRMAVVLARSSVSLMLLLLPPGARCGSRFGLRRLTRGTVRRRARCGRVCRGVDQLDTLGGRLVAFRAVGDPGPGAALGAQTLNAADVASHF